MSDQQQPCLSDGEDDGGEHIDQPAIAIVNDAEIRKNLFDEFDVPSKQKVPSDSSGREYMRVYLRVRPFSNEEIEAKEDQNCVEKESNTSVLMNAPKESFAFKNSTRAGGDVSHRFTFSNVFSEDTSQKMFFDETTLPLVTDFIHGQNCLVFTYGVTNSGKTYTIQGSPKDGGVLPRSLDVLFNSIQGKQYNRMNLKPRFCSDVTRLEDEAEQKEQAFKNALLSTLNKETFDINAFLKLEPDSFGEQDISKANSCADESSLHNTLKSHDGEHEEQSIDAEEDVSRIADDTTINVDAQGPVKFAVWVSFAEIYNEVIYDLLEPCPMGKGKKRTTLRLGDDTNGNPYVKGLREIHVSNADEAYKILKIGQKNQRIASTKLNQCSSRSHCIFNVKVLRVVDVADPHVARVSRLSFVDLAGSERYSKTQSKGDRLKEAGNINTSLMTLGKCLEYLRHNQRNPSQPLIIPFRESKLTRLFQGFFCGRGRASMIVNVNMCASMFDETFHVLKFSAIAKKVTTRVTKPVDIPLPCKKPRIAAPKQTRLSVPWANGGFRTPAPVSNSPLVEEEEEGEDEVMDEGNCYQQELVNLVKVLQEKLIEEKRKVQTLEVKIREEVCGEMAEQLVAIETAYSERVKMEVTAVEEKCDRRIELLTQSIKKTRKRARIERVEEDEEEWVPSVFLHAEKVKVQEKEHLIKNLNAKVAELRQEVKQLQDSRKEEVDKSSVVLELQTHLNDANEQVAELKQMLEEAGEAFTDKEAEIQKLKAALDEEETCSKKQDAALQQLTVQLEEAKSAPKERADPDELARANVALEAAMAKLADTENNLAMKDSMMIELVRTLEETREELAREKSYVVQAFDNDEEIIRLKDELQTAETTKVALEKDLSSKEETIETLRKLAEEAKAEALERTSQISDDEMVRLKDELQAAEAKMAAMEKDVSSKVETIESLKKMVEDAKAEALEKAVQMAEKELEVEQTNVKGTEDVKNDSAEETKNDDAVKELERQLEESTKALDKKNSQVITKNNAIRRLELSLAEKERLLSDMEKLPKEPNLRAKEELKTLRRRVMQTDRDAKELMAAKEDAQNELAASKNELQQTNTSLEELKADVVKREETFQSLQGQFESQRSQIAALQTELDSEKNDLLEKEKEVQEAKEELIVLRKTEPELAEMKELLASAKSRVKELEEEVQRAKGELVSERKTSDSELAEVKELRISAEKKVQELEEEVFSANEKMSQCQDDVQRYQNNLVPELKAKVQDLEQELARSGDTLKDAEIKLETNARESRAESDKWVKDMEQKTKEVSDLREALKTLDQEKCQELDKVWQELVSMQKTIEERNKTIDDLEKKLRVTGREQDSSKEQMQALSAKLNSALQENTALEGRMEAMTKHMDLLKSDAGKEKDVSVNLKQLREEQDRVMAEQAQALDERQTELETLSTELQTWQDKCSLTCKELERKKEEILNLHKQVSVASDEKKQLITKVNAMSSQQHATESDAKSQLGRIEGEVEKLNSDRSALEEQVRRKDEEIRKVNESKDDIMKTMREAFDVAKAKKAEYEVKLATVREQCRKEMKREMDEELRRAKRDYQRQLEEKDRSLEEMNSKKEAVVVESEERTSIDVPVTGDNKQAQDSRTSASLTKSTAKKNLKRNSSNLSLAEVKKRMEEGSKLRKEESDGEFTPGSVRKSQRARSSTKKVVRTNSCRSKQKPIPAKATVLSTMEENETAKDDKVTEKRKLFSDIKESHSSSGEEKETTKSSAQANEETENVPPSKAPSTTKKRRGKLFQKAIGVGSLLSPAKSVSKETKSEQDSVAAIITRQLRPRTIKYN